jgi:capsular exopolysaccharide synthesis family protein
MNNTSSFNSSSNQSYNPEDEGLDLKRYLSLFMNNWYWFAGSLFISLSIAYGVNRYSERIYTVSSNLLIKDDQIGGSMTSSESFIPGSNLFRNQQNLKNEMGILKSYDLNRRVIDSLPEFQIVYVGLGRRKFVERQIYYKDCPFKVISDSIDYQPLGVEVFIRIKSKESFKLEFIGDTKIDQDYKFGDYIKKNGFNFIIELRNSLNFVVNTETANRYFFYYESSERLANSFRSTLSISPIEKDATLVNLTVAGAVPGQETDFLNKLMELYMQQGLELKNKTADNTIKFIDKQLGIISDSLYNAEDNLQSFRLRNKLLDLSKEGTYIQSQLERFSNEKVTLELQQKYYEYLLEYLNSRNESGDIIAPSIMGVSDQMLVSLVGELSKAQIQKKQMEMNLSAELQPIYFINERISDARKTLNENVRNSLINIKQSVSDVNDRLALVAKEIEKLPGTERQYINIQRVFEINNTIYTFLLEKRAEAGIAKASNVPDNRIIDLAKISDASMVLPKKKQNYTIGFAFGIMLPLFMIFILDLLNNKIIDRRDIEKGTKAPILGYISHNELKSEIPVINKPGSVLSESFRSIRTSLKYFFKETDHPVIAVTSTISSEGKTFISVNLAAITALLDKKVLLIGLDLRKPRIHRFFDVQNTEGMSTFLSGNCDYKDVIQKTTVDNLYYASSGPIPPNPAELIESPRMQDFILEAKKEYDYIIIDTPPVAVVADALLLANYIDVNIFVVRQRYSSKNTLELIQEYYQSGRLKNIGIIINDISLSGYYGYGLRYGYAMGYGYSYGNNYYGKYAYSRYGYSDKSKDYYTEE